VYDYDNDPHQLIPENNKYSRYKKDKQGITRVKSGLQNKCWKLWHANVITWDGLVVPCCFDKDAIHRLGDLKKQPFREVWHSEPYRQFRQQLMQGRKNIDICSNCSEGLQVWEN
jgi:radical SAM protein with 4Fe4S-binding SPASM domain